MSLKISLNIQSMGRPNDLLSLKFAPGAVLWVHEKEFDSYKSANPGANIEPLPDDLIGNLPKVKNYILDKRRGDDITILMDDDIRYFGRWVNTEIVKFVRLSELWPYILKYSWLCLDWGFHLWGVNVKLDKQFYREYTPFSTKSYVSSSFSCFTRNNSLRYDPDFPLKEDYDMTIQQCNINRGLLRVNGFFYVKKSAENVGGCAGYRNIEIETEQIKKLQEKWGSTIVKFDMGESRSHTSVKKRNFDINPIIKVPIKGV